jgi:hypothetical protein
MRFHIGFPSTLRLVAIARADRALLSANPADASTITHRMTRA